MSVRGFSDDGSEEGIRCMLRLRWTFCAIVSVVMAGDWGWSVMVMLRAEARALIREGSAVPGTEESVIL